MVLPVQVFTQNDVKIRFKERYTSQALNKKFIGIPRGVYLGLTPSSPDANTLVLSPDVTEGLSLGRVRNQTGVEVLDLVTDQVISMDFTTHTFTADVYVVLKASYAIGAASSAQIVAQLTPPDGLTSIGICRITGRTVTLDLVFASAPDRHTPIANTGIPFGFMTGGAEQDRAAAALSVLEVVAARTGIDLTVHANLQTRLNTDLAGSSMAGRLARALDLAQGLDYAIGAVASVNVSGSFSGRARQLRGVQPNIDLPPAASETSSGVITAPTDTGRNLVPLFDPTNATSIYDTVTGLQVFGRLTNTGVTTPFAGTANFANAGNSVDGVGTTFITQGAQAGDLIEGADGFFYEIATVNAETGLGALTLVDTYAGATASKVTPAHRRYTLTFQLATGAAFTFPAPITIRPFFPVFLQLHQLRYSALAGILTRLTATRFAPFGGVAPQTALQAGDPRITTLFAPSHFFGQADTVNPTPPPGGVAPPTLLWGAGGAPVPVKTADILFDAVTGKLTINTTGIYKFIHTTVLFGPGAIGLRTGGAVGTGSVISLSGGQNDAGFSISTSYVHVRAVTAGDIFDTFITAGLTAIPSRNSLSIERIA